MTSDFTKTFKIDVDSSTSEHLYVDIPGKGTVQIQNKPTGILVSIYPLQVADKPVATAWADMAKLWFPEDEK